MVTAWNRTRRTFEYVKRALNETWTNQPPTLGYHMHGNRKAWSKGSKSVAKANPQLT
jgi:hypothetical protein